MLDYFKSIERETERNRHESSYAAYVAAQEQRRSMQFHVRGLAQVLGPALNENHEALKHLQAITDGLSVQNSHLNTIVQSVPPIARKPPGTIEVVSKVFAVPELLERILLYLNPVDLLRIQQVDHLFFNSIQGSMKLLCKMGLMAQENGHVSAPPASVDTQSFFCFYEMYSSLSRDVPQDNDVVVKAGFSDLENSPNLGSRCRNMLICQPPLKSMSVHTRCCHPTWSWNDSDEDLDPITSESGLVVGDLLDAHNRVTADHRLCPEAEPPEHGSDGFVNPHVSFEATMVAENDDPSLLERKQNDQKRQDDESQVRDHTDRMTPYIAAKRSASENGEPIPTLAQYEEDNGSIDT